MKQKGRSTKAVVMIMVMIISIIIMQMEATKATTMTGKNIEQEPIKIEEEILRIVAEQEKQQQQQQEEEKKNTTTTTTTTIVVATTETIVETMKKQQQEEKKKEKEEENIPENMVNMIMEPIKIMTTTTNQNNEEQQQQQQQQQKNKLRKTENNKTTIVAHRGASGIRPEHTLEAYAKAIEAGADYIEQDVVMTKDGEVIVCHDRELSGFTDIETQKAYFGEKVVKKKQDHEYNKPKYMEDWFAEDYTFDQLKKLNIKQRYGFRPQGYNGLYRIYKMREVLEWVKATKPTVGLYIELKNPHYLNTIGLNIQQGLFDLLVEYGYLVKNKEDNTKYDMPEDKKLIIQCFEATTLKWFKAKTTNLPLIQLVYSNLKKMQPDNSQQDTYEDMMTNEGLREVALYAHGIGPHKTHILKQDANNNMETTNLVQMAHAHNLAVHPYTFRADNAFLMNNMTYEQEINLFMDLDIDGFFTDFPKESIDIVQAYERYNMGHYTNKINQWQKIIMTIVTSSEAMVTLSIVMVLAIIQKYVLKKEESLTTNASSSSEKNYVPFVLAEPTM